MPNIPWSQLLKYVDFAFLCFLNQISLGFGGICDAFFSFLKFYRLIQESINQKNILQACSPSFDHSAVWVM